VTYCPYKGDASYYSIPVGGDRSLNAVWTYETAFLSGVPVRRSSIPVSVGPLTAALLEFSSHRDPKRAAALTMTAQAGGFIAALLVGGALTEYAPWPTRLCFLVFAGLLAALTIATWFLPRHTASDTKGGSRPRMPFFPRNMRRAFATASTAMMAAYTFGVLVLSLGWQVEHDLIGSSNALLNGAVLALFPIVLGPVGIVAKTLSSRFALNMGSVASVLGMGLLCWGRRPPGQHTACCSWAVWDSSTQ
jgi:hypothetical protein